MLLLLIVVAAATVVALTDLAFLNRNVWSIYGLFLWYHHAILPLIVCDLT